MKKILALVLALCMIFALCACGQSAAPAASAKVKIGMVTDVGGVNDKSFNQTSWEGLQALAKEDSRFEVTTSSPRPTLTTRPTSTPSSMRSTT